MLAQNYFGGHGRRLVGVAIQPNTITINPIRAQPDSSRTSERPASRHIQPLPPARSAAPQWRPDMDTRIPRHSPAIDTGNNFLDFLQDQRAAESNLPPYQYPRPSNGTTDVGAHEVDSADVPFNAALEWARVCRGNNSACVSDESIGVPVPLRSVWTAERRSARPSRAPETARRARTLCDRPHRCRSTPQRYCRAHRSGNPPA